MFAADAFHLWVLVVATVVLTAWWLAVRPGASYRGASAPVSVLIMVLAVLLGVLALGDGQDRRVSLLDHPALAGS
jgi:hypothetical protein